MATIKDVAREAGVAVCTVSFAMNGSAHVAEETKKRIFKAIEKLNYKPNQSARGLVKGKTDNICLAVPMGIDALEGSHFFELLQGIGEVVAACNYDLVIAFPKKGEKVEHIMDSFRKKSADGLILMPTRIGDRSYQELIEQRYPLILLGSPYMENVCNSVNANNVQASYEATRYLLDKGHRRIGFITPCSLDYEVAVARLEGYKQALQAYGLPIDDKLIEIGNFDRDSGYAQTERLLDLAKTPTAILAGRDLLAVRALEVAERRGIAVPDRLAVVTFENSTIAQNSRPPLSSVVNPMREIGYEAARMLIDIIEGKRGFDDTENKLLPCQFIERKSSDSNIGRE